MSSSRRAEGQGTIGKTNFSDKAALKIKGSQSSWRAIDPVLNRRTPEEATCRMPGRPPAQRSKSKSG
jgi:hypothetical protein